MEEDIKFLEKQIKRNNEWFEKFGKHIIFNEVIADKVQNLINKYKEQEKIIELMANFINNIADIDEDICKVMGQRPYCTEYNEEGKCVECVKSYFKEKARENNEI